MKGKNNCEKYGIAITNYALDEEMNVSRQELFNHLLRCKQCREELFDWQNNIAVLRAEEYHNNQEVKNKTEELIRELRKEMIKSMPVIEPLPGEQVLDHDEDIGNAARKLWYYLAQNGKIKLNDLKRKAKLPVDIFHQALGWLARGNQIHRTRVKNATFTYLAPEEIQRHQAQAQR